VTGRPWLAGVGAVTALGIVTGMLEPLVEAAATDFEQRQHDRTRLIDTAIHEDRGWTAASPTG